jgi:AraC-like DNA-binding protein/mannose-6-phosphate isomerase-like protein (cupin superfamily)
MGSNSLTYEAVLRDPASSFLWRDFSHTLMKVNWHYHPEVEINYIIHGSGLRFVGDAIETFHADELYLFGANTPHAWHAPRSAKAPVETVCIQFLPAAFGADFLTIPEMRRVKTLFNRARQGILFRGKAQRRGVELLLNMRRERRGSIQRLSGLLAILGVMADTSEYTLLSDSRVDPELDDSANGKINAVFTLINQNLHDMPTQARCAQALRLSPAAFSRFFKRCVGKPFVQYINELRISMACRELIETEKNVTEIAYDVGFNTLSNFNHHFKALQKTTPREYRRTASILSTRERPRVKWRKA